MGKVCHEGVLKEDEGADSSAASASGRAPGFGFDLMSFLGLG